MMIKGAKFQAGSERMKSGVLLRATLILMFFGAGVFALPPEYHEMIYSDNKALVGLRCISLSLYVELSGD